MDYLYALMAMGAVALPLLGVWWLMEWQARRRARSRPRRKPRVS